MPGLRFLGPLMGPRPLGFSVLVVQVTTARGLPGRAFDVSVTVSSSIALSPDFMSSTGSGSSSGELTSWDGPTLILG